MQTHTFNKQQSGWYIHLPEFIEQGGNKEDLQMVEGADTMLEIMAKGASSVALLMHTEPFADADLLELIEICDPVVGGGYYLLREWEGEELMCRMWLCRVTEFVFNSLPENIFVKRA